MKAWLLYVFILIAGFANAQANPTRELSVNVCATAPVYYGLYSLGSGWVTPEFNASYLLNIRYKSKRNIIFEAEFQPYNFDYSGREISIEGTSYGGSHGSNSTKYIDKVSQRLIFSYDRFSFGVGKQINLKKAYLCFSAGVAAYTGSLGYSQVKMQVITNPSSSMTHPLYGTYYSFYNFNPFPWISPYNNLYAGYNINKYFSATMGVGYGLYAFGDGGSSQNNWDGGTIYMLMVQPLLSCYLGVKFNILYQECTPKE